MNFDNVIKLNERRLRLMPLPPRCASQPQASPYNLTMTPSYWNQATAELANHDHVMAELAEAYPRDGKHSAAEVSNALAELSKKLHLKLQWSEARAPKKGELAGAMMDQVRNGLEVALRSFDASKLKVDELYRQSLLGLCDDLWGQHIEEMNRMKDSVQSVSVAEQDPEVVYKMRAFEAFDGLLDEIQRRSVVENVPQIVVGAPVLATERKLSMAA